MLRVVVTYDISDDKARKQVSEHCLDYGLDRQQYSVFSGLLKPIHIRALTKVLRPLTKEGHILIIPIASNDWDRRVEMGQKKGDDA